MWNNEVFEKLNKKVSASVMGGGEKRIEKQHAAGKLTARERLEILFDKGTFIEVGGLIESRITDFGIGDKKVPGDGVVVGYGKVNGRTVFASSEDFTVIGGTLGEYHSLKICRIMDMALETGAPFVSINDSGGARIEEGICSLSGYSGIFYRNTKLSGVVPQISVILGPCAGGACYSPAISDFIFMSKSTSLMFITGPQVVKAVTGEQVSSADLGSADVHMTKSGVTHFVYDNDEQCLNGVKELLSYLPQNSREKAESKKTTYTNTCGDLQSIVSDNQRKTYNVKLVIEKIVDDDSFFEVQPEFAKNMVVGFSRINGESVGIVANQPNFLGGSIDCDSADKAARFIRFCDCFNIPVVSLVDVTGFLPGQKQEHSGIIRHGAKMLFAYSEATVPKISLILRKAYGGAYIAMNSKNMGADIVYAWPIAQMAVMGAEGAVDIIFKRKIAESENPVQLRQELIAEYEDKFANPYIAAARGYVDEIIEPQYSRERIIAALDMLKSKKQENPYKKHGNIPL